MCGGWKGHKFHFLNHIQHDMHIYILSNMSFEYESNLSEHTMAFTHYRLLDFLLFMVYFVVLKLMGERIAHFVEVIH